MLLIAIKLISIVSACECVKILAIAPMPSYSHQILYRPIWRKLLSCGHHVTLLTTDPMRDPALTNLTEIDLHFAYKLWNETEFHNTSKSLWDLLLVRRDMFVNLIDNELESAEVKNLIQDETKHFDLMMIEFLYPTMYSFSERFKCPFIGLTSLDATSNAHNAVGNPTHPIAYPEYSLPFSAKLSLYERLLTIIHYILKSLYLNYMLYPELDKVVAKHFGEGYMSSFEIERNVTMLFVNANPVIHDVRPVMPNTVLIGDGIHLQPPKPLSQELQKFLDDSINGAVYLSLGTNVNSMDLPANFCNIVLETFNELPYNLLWKLEDNGVVYNSSQVMVQEWFPQQDVLAHPNVRLFITQGGHQSVEEAIYNGKPMVFIPFRHDQPSNAKRFSAKGLGKAIDYHTVNKAILKMTIQDIITNLTYRNSVVSLGKLASDQPMTGLDRVIWWTEYVIRHKEKTIFRSGIRDIPLYQYFLLDVIGLVLIALLAAIFIMLLFLKTACKILGVFKVNKKLKVQ